MTALAASGRWGEATCEAFDKRRATPGSRHLGGEELYGWFDHLHDRNLVLALFTGITMFGLITEIIAIVFAPQVNSKLVGENRTDAGDAARVAKVCYWITLAVFVVGMVVVCVSMFVVFFVLFSPSCC